MKVRKAGTMKKRLFRYTEISPAELGSLDLREEAEQITAGEIDGVSAEGMQAFIITILDEDEHPYAETADALYVPSFGRLGIAWGADATWADVDDVKSGIEMWLNNDEEWARRN
jgi:hypothetical protein